MNVAERSSVEPASLKADKKRLSNLRGAVLPLVFAGAGALLAVTGSVEAQSSAASSITPTPARVDRSQFFNWPIRTPVISQNVERTRASVGAVRPQSRISTMQGGDDLWNLRLINALPNNGAENQIVAILGAGIDNHADFEGRFVSQFSTVASQPDGDGTPDGYGTFMAGLVTGKNTGAARPKIMSGEVLTNDSQGSFETVANGIVEAVKRGAGVVVAPIGVPVSYCPEVLQNAVNYAVAHKVAVVASVGDRGLAAADTPANCDNAVAVQGVDGQGYLSWDSSFARKAWSAGGGGSEELIRSTAKGGSGYAYRYGSAPAASQVGGALARLKQARPDLSVSQLVDWMEENMSPVTGFPSAVGIVNLGRALANVPIGPTNTPSPTDTPTPRPTETPTPTLTPTATVPAYECNPRPPVRVVTRMEGEDMIVEFTAGAGDLADIIVTNRETSNAIIEPIPMESKTQRKLRLRRARAGSFTVNFLTSDRCGDWRTFAGRGS